MMENRRLYFKKLGTQSALPHIQKRIEYRMPIEMIDVSDIERAINGLHVVIDKPVSPEEVGTMLNEIKRFLLDEIKKMPKHERYLCKKEEDEQK